MEKKVQKWQREKVQDIIINTLFVIEGFLLTIIVVGAVKILDLN